MRSPVPRLLHPAPALLLLALGACASWGEAADGPFYPQGVTDGCRTAEARNASFSTDVYQDEELFETEASYRAGWRAGFAQCQPQGGQTARPSDFGEQGTGFE